MTNGLEGPVLPAHLKVDARAGPCGARVARVGRAHGDPVFEDLDLVGGKPALRRHLHVGVGVADGFEDQAGAGFSGDDRRTVVAACLPAGFRVEGEAALDFAAVRMALKAALLKHGQHLLFKEGCIRTQGWRSQSVKQKCKGCCAVSHEGRSQTSSSIWVASPKVFGRTSILSIIDRKRRQSWRSGLSR